MVSVRAQGFLAENCPNGTLIQWLGSRSEDWSLDVRHPGTPQRGTPSSWGVLRLGQGPPLPRSGGVSKEDRGAEGRGETDLGRRSRPPCPQQPQAGAPVVLGPALRPRRPGLPGLPSQREVLSVQGTPFGAPGLGSGQGWSDPGLRIPPAGIRPRTHGTRRRETYKRSRQGDNLRAAFTSFTSSLSQHK